MSDILPPDDFQEALRKAILNNRQQYETQRKLLGLLPSGEPVRECEVAGCSSPATCICTPLAGITYYCDEHAEPYKRMGPDRWKPIGSPEHCGTCGREWPTGEVLCFTCNSYVGPNGIIRRDDLSPETDPDYMPEDDPWGDENAWRDGSIRTGINRYRRGRP